MKVNVDFVAFQSSNSYGIGVVICHDERHFVAVRTQRLDGSVDPYVGEKMAARTGILLAWELGMSKVELEGDAINV